MGKRGVELSQDKLIAVKNYINKQRGMDMIDTGDDVVIERIPSGSYLLDRIIDGGIPLGRFSLFYGAPMSGKTTIALTTIASAQKKGMLCAYLDSEKTYSTDWANKLGVDGSNLLVSSVSLGEPLVDTVADLIDRRFDLVVVDSIAAMCPKEFLESASKSKVSPLARLVNEMMCKVNALNSKTAIIFINQPREKVGVLFGSKLSLPGGKSVAHYASLTIKFWINGRIKEKDEIIGRVISCHVDKNKLGIPERTAEFNVYFNSGIDNGDELLTLAIQQGVVTKSGGWYYYASEKHQGRNTFILEANSKWRKAVSL